MFRTPNHIDYEINWTDLNTSTTEEIPLCRVCPALLKNDHTYKSTYWKSLLVKDVYGFNVIDGKLTPRGYFLSNQQRSRAEKYHNLLHTGQITKENCLPPLKAHPTVLLENLYPLLVFNALRFSLPLCSTRLYQIAH